MNRGALGYKLKLDLPPPEVSISKFLTQSGTFKDGDLRVNKDGIQIISLSETAAPPPIQPSDDQLSLADLDVIKVIGKGNSGNVQLVKHKLTCQFFALKVIQINTDDSTCRAIAQELRINQFSFMDGGSLADFLDKVGSIPEKYLAGICKHVLHGLCYLHHEKHIIHRDLKPSNLLINHRGEVKISDFGVSKILSSTTELANTYVGTYHYMSPERIDARNYGNKSDIWSLGVALLECATGKFPYSPPGHEENWTGVYELVATIVEHPPPRADSRRFSPRFCSFISECLQKDPKDRKAAKELLNHPFVNEYCVEAGDLSRYFSDAGSLISTLPN